MIEYLMRQKWIWLDRLVLRRLIQSTYRTGGLKVILGAGYTSAIGWVSSDYPVFDIKSPLVWKVIFQSARADNFLLEHVLEHFTEKEVEICLKNMLKFLRSEGVIRIAVPDANHPSREYIEYVRPGGSGEGADDHKSFWCHSDFLELAKKLAIDCKLVEYWDDQGNFVSEAFDESNGAIHRRNVSIDGINHTSLIVDLSKRI
jgi:predicted SAM-dependent methyltransferase